MEYWISKRGACLWMIAFFICCHGASNELMAHGSIHEAIERVSNKIENNPEDVFLYFERGLLYQEHGDLNLALDDYLRVLSLEPAFHACRLQLARIYLLQSLPEAALRQINHYQEKEPENPFAYETRASILQQLGMLEEAVADLRKVIVFKNDNAIRPDDYLELAAGILAAFPDDYPNAIAALEEGLRRLGPIIAIQSRMVELLVQQKKYADAVLYIDRILENLTNKKSWLIKKAEILEGWGKKEEAAFILQQLPKGRIPEDLWSSSERVVPVHTQDADTIPFWQTVSARTIIRGPYLQSGGSGSMIIKWRTDGPTTSKVWYGTAPNALNQSIKMTGNVTNHEVKIIGLRANTRYYYAIGDDTGYLTGGDSRHFFRTSPPKGTVQPVRAWVLGDCGTGDDNARAVRDGYTSYAGSNLTDLILLLGDNAYEDGSDADYQKAIFENMYEDQLIHSVLWATPGNHDYASADAATQSGAYYNIFTLPKQGEIGGLASGTEAYYSFDYANIHFISLDSHDSGRNPGDPMLVWLENDLNATNQDWVIVFFHHPPYSKGSHDSDTESRLVEMRENVLPLLEEKGVDLVLCGHSHSYERSYLIHGHYGHSSSLTQDMIIDDGSGRLDEAGAYHKYLDEPEISKGQVYLAAGSSGKVTDGTFDHPVMYYSAPTLGSLSLEVNGLQLDLKFIGVNGEVLDYFTIQKERLVGIPPSVTVSLPFQDAYFPVAQTIRLEADAFDRDGRITDVEFFVDGESVGIDYDVPYAVDWKIPAQGRYSIHAVAQDDKGNPDKSKNNDINVGFIEVCRQVNSSNDDAEERMNGDVVLTSSDLEMSHDPSTGIQIIGMRFRDLGIPQGVIIQRAYLQFTVDDDNNEDPCVLKIYGQNDGDPKPFSNADFDISRRIKTQNVIEWSPGVWNTLDGTGDNQRTPDLKAIIQEIVNHSTFSTASDIVLMVTGTGRRTAVSHDGWDMDAPRLCIEYTIRCAAAEIKVASPEEPICQAQDITLSSLPAKGYKWSTGDTTSQISFMLYESTPFFLTVWDDNKCIQSDTLQVTVRSIPEIQFDFDQDVLRILGYDGASGYIYKWNNNETTPSIKIGSSGLYCVTVTDQAGCSVDNCIQLVVPTTDISNSPYEMYPNPFSRDLYIGPFENSQNLKLQVFDILGRPMPVAVMKKEEYLTLSFEELPDGIYTIAIREGENVTIAKAIKHLGGG